MSVEELSFKERFEFLRDIVKHEDTLTNFRTTWTLVFHGLLFSAFAAGVALFEKLKFPAQSANPIATGLLVLCTLGVVSALAAYFGLRASEKQLRISTDWWVEQTKEAQLSTFPPIFIHSKSKAKFGASAYFLLLGAAWVFLALLVVCTKLPETIPAQSQATPNRVARGF
jgi:hypothetical protein